MSTVSMPHLEEWIHWRQWWRPLSICIRGASDGHFISQKHSTNIWWQTHLIMHNLLCIGAIVIHYQKWILLQFQGFIWRNEYTGANGPICMRGISEKQSFLQKYKYVIANAFHYVRLAFRWHHCDSLSWSLSLSLSLWKVNLYPVSHAQLLVAWSY